jgi:hypothetical protein
MMELTIAPVTLAGFSLEPSLQEGVLVLKFAGNADMAAITALSTYLKRLHQEALRLRVGKVLCDFSGLYFMNSSCFKSFVTWVTAVESVEPTKRYKIQLRGNNQLHWQKRSLEALRCLAETVVFIE